MNTKQQLESLDIWLKEAYAKGYKDASEKMSPENYSVDNVVKHFTEFTKAYTPHRYVDNGDIYYVQGDRGYTLQEVINKFKLTYGYDEE